jgi:hypothetical protein
MNQSCLLKYYIRKKGLNFLVDLKNKKLAIDFGVKELLHSIII